MSFTLAALVSMLSTVYVLILASISMALFTRMYTHVHVRLIFLVQRLFMDEDILVVTKTLHVFKKKKEWPNTSPKRRFFLLAPSEIPLANHPSRNSPCHSY